jgi:glycosyltransferase involved in cell wall biosynthesis
VDFSFPLFSFFVKKPKILHLHGIHIKYFKRYHLSRFILKHVTDYYISISKKMKREVMELGVPEGRIAYLPNAVDVRLFTPSHRIKENDLLLFVGRLSPDKCLHVLIDSLRYLKKSVSLVIIGPPASQKYFQIIMKLIEKENQRGKHKITYIGALEDQAEIVKWYQKATIFILPSSFEGFPVVILEALACETPVIATPVGGIPEVVKEGKNGLLVPPNDPLQLAKAISYLLDNKDLRRKMGDAGRKFIIKNFSIEIVVRKLCNIYKQILATNQSFFEF